MLFYLKPATMGSACSGTKSEPPFDFGSKIEMEFFAHYHQPRVKTLRFSSFNQVAILSQNCSAHLQHSPEKPRESQ